MEPYEINEIIKNEVIDYLIKHQGQDIYTDAFWRYGWCSIDALKECKIIADKRRRLIKIMRLNENTFLYNRK